MQCYIYPASAYERDYWNISNELAASASNGNLVPTNNDGNIMDGTCEQGGGTNNDNK